MSSSTTQSIASARAAHKASEDSIKDTFESIIIAFILAFVFRAYVVEAFVIPTGSMAPTLLGEHLDIRCPQCGYHFTVDVNSPGAAQEAVCPMCHFPISIAPGIPLSAGDRILVHKYLYSVAEPQRWDVVVFKDPSNPHTNFIKRLVGLPNESLEIIDGNVYVKRSPDLAGSGPAAASAEKWHIARKSERPEVQRAVWQPVYYSDYIPLDGGNGQDRGDHVWSAPWLADDPSNWDINCRRTYHHRNAQPGQIRFDFQRQARGGLGWYAYNEFRGSDELAGLTESGKSPGFRPEPIEDVRISAKFEAEGQGLAVALRTTARLDDTRRAATQHILSGRIDAAGHAAIEEVDDQGRVLRTLDQGEAGPFRPGVARQVELWYVDQEASMWVEGERICLWRFEMDIDDLKNRRPPDQYPSISIVVSGAPVTLHQVNVDRDLYYGSMQQPSHGGTPAQGAIIKFDDGSPPKGAPINLENDEFFCMGDNSPMSYDGRFWTTDQIDPWIKLRMLDDHRQKNGVVPRRLMMGRAFFVYFPAPFGWKQVGGAVFPNFGDMRFIH